MLHMVSIRDAIERNQVSEIEDAFRALILFPHEEEISDAPDTADGLVLLLRDVCAALAGDDRTMPEGVQEAVRDALSRRVNREDVGSSYGAAADVVDDCAAEWREIFVAGGAKEGA